MVPEEKAPPVTVWTPDATKSGDSFIAGRKYTIAGSISIDRWGHYEDGQVEVGMGRTFEQLQQAFTQGYELCNQVVSGRPVFADLAIIMRDGAMGCTLAHARSPHVVLKLCALFINFEGEDTRYAPSEDVIASKIRDWTEAGISMDYFFAFAFRSIPGFIAAYKANFPTTSPRTEGQPNRDSQATNRGTLPNSNTSTTAPSSSA